jgi:hypothetical protein
MEMQVKDSLARVHIRVDDHSVAALRESLALRQIGCDLAELS